MGLELQYIRIETYTQPEDKQESTTSHSILLYYQSIHPDPLTA